MSKQDTHRTPKNERTQLEQDFRDKAANNFYTSRKCEYDSASALYYGQYIANKWAAVSVRTSHRYGLMQNMTKEHYDIVSETKAESYANKVMRGYEALEEMSKDLP
jgi:hypothetical protein